MQTLSCGCGHASRPRRDGHDEHPAGQRHRFPARQSPVYSNRYGLQGYYPGSTVFCRQTRAARQEIFNALWLEVERQYVDAESGLRAAGDVRRALETCFMTCDPSAVGADDAGGAAGLKVAACNAAVHWLPRFQAQPDTCHLSAEGQSAHRTERVLLGAVCCPPTAVCAPHALFPTVWSGATGTPLAV